MSSLGKFVWYELMTSDAVAAETFYKTVVGWGSRDASHPGMKYTAFTVGEASIGGVMAIPPEAEAQGARPVWLGYVAVDDADAYAQKFAAAGGAIHKPATEIPDVGSFAIVADPQGAVVVLFQGLPSMPMPHLGDAPGVFNWRELMATDGVAAFDFYAAMFGWTKGVPMDMGEFGVYQLFNAADGETIGGMMTKPQNLPHPFWTFYAHVDGIKAAVERLEAAGGKLINGPHQVPTGSWVAQGLDPQGAMFSLVSPNA